MSKTDSLLENLRMESNQNRFIQRMVAFRKSKKISQAKLAELCDVSNGTIGNIECGVTKPSFDLIFKIADSLDVTAKDLFDFENPVQDKNTSLTNEQLSKVKEVMNCALESAIKNLSTNYEINHNK